MIRARTVFATISLAVTAIWGCRGSAGVADADQSRRIVQDSPPGASAQPLLDTLLMELERRHEVLRAPPRGNAFRAC